MATGTATDSAAVMAGTPERMQGRDEVARFFDGSAHAALAVFVGETLAAYKVPAHWELRAESLPRNAAGKVLKNVLAGAAQNQFVEE